LISRRQALTGGACVAAGAAAASLASVGWSRLGARSTPPPTPAPVAPVEPSAFAPLDRLPDPGAPYLKDIASESGRYFGAALRDTLFSDPDFRSLVVRECNMAVCEGAMKFKAIRPNPHVYDFTAADRFLEFTEAHGMAMRGHALVWHGSTWPWFEEQLQGPDKWRVFEDHIRTVAARYRGRIHSWDVVNEPFEAGRYARNGIRRSVFLENLGEDYIRVAFEVAHDADPESLKFLNEFMFSWPQSAPEKVSGALRTLESLLAAGAPVHGFGLQGHLLTQAEVPVDLQRSFLQEVRAMGMKVYVTELDVRDAEAPQDPQTRDRLVADRVRTFLDVVEETGGYEALLTWGLSDRYTWVSEYYPREDGGRARSLPFDEGLGAKPFYNVVRESLTP